jgi:hypothetical protein
MVANNTSRNTPGRMDLPFVGLATFARQPAYSDWDTLDGADVAVWAYPSIPPRAIAMARVSDPAPSASANRQGEPGLRQGCWRRPR